MESTFSKADKRYMQHAIELARKGLYSAKPNPAVGCVLVKDDQVIGKGWHKQAGLPHAERVALADAGKHALGATAYVTLEPCSHYGRTPPCADGLIEAGVTRVVVAMQDPNPLVSGQGIRKLQQAGIEVQIGLLESEAQSLNPGFIHVMQTKKPFVRVKIASSLDGRTAMANGESKWITGPESREDVHKLRARSGAIVTGIGTVLADDPSLTVRLSESQLTQVSLENDTCHPLRVVLDSRLNLPLDAKMLAAAGRTIVMTTHETLQANPELAEKLIAKGAELVAVSAHNNRLDIHSVLSYLVENESIRDVLVESGAQVAGSFIQSGAVNELHCYMAPVLLGDKAKPMFVLDGLDHMVDKLNFEISSTDLFGKDIRLVMKPTE